MMNCSPLLRHLLCIFSLVLLAACGGGGGSDGGNTPGPTPPPPPDSYTITTSASPDEGGIVTGAGTYPGGEFFTLTAVPAPGFVFGQWTENGVEVPSTASAELFGTVNRDRTIVAEFLPVTLELAPDDLTLNIGDSADLSATLVAEGEESVDVSSSASWYSSDNELATVNDQGAVTALAEGTVSITAEFGGQVASISVRVLPDAISSLTFEPATVSLAINESYTPTLIAHYLSGERAEIALDRAGWSSSSGTIGVTANGQVTAISAGGAQITASISELVATLNVTVADAVLQSLELESPVAEGGEVVVGAQLNFIARGEYSDGESRDVTDRVTWTSTNPVVLRIENGGATAGRATALDVGNTSVSASFQEITSVPVSVQVVLDPAAPVLVSLLATDDVIRWPAVGEDLNKSIQARVLNEYGEPPTDEQNLIFSIVRGPLTFAGGSTEETATTENGQASVIVTATGPGDAVVRVGVADTALTAQSRLFVIEMIDQVLIGSRDASTVEVDGKERLRVRFILANLSRLPVPVTELRIRVPDRPEVILPAAGGTTENSLTFHTVPGRGIVSQGILFDPGTEGIEATYRVEDPATGQQIDIEL